MKKVVGLLFVALSIYLLAFKQVNKDDIKFIDKGIYKVKYSEYYKNPIQVTYKLYKPEFKVNRNHRDFYNEPNVNTANNIDFKSNNWDKGHMCPAGDFSDTEEHLNTTFSYINCAVQHKDLNRGLWENLEKLERQWSKIDSLSITIDIIVNENSNKLKSGTYIPNSFRKTIIYLTSKKKKVFEFPNENCLGNVFNYQIY